jgi:hypothetical protein
MGTLAYLDIAVTFDDSTLPLAGASVMLIFVTSQRDPLLT